MKPILSKPFLIGVAVVAIGGRLWAADANRGAQLLDDAGCLQCHTAHAQGAGHEPSGIAPELGSGLAPVYTAPALASAVWNHTPAMLAEMQQDRLHRPRLTEDDWRDLFAYLYSTQFLESPAEATRGKAILESKQCSGCHSAAGPGKAPLEWAQLDDPVTLAHRMWSHAAAMEAAGREATWTSSGWTKLTGRDFLDLTAYVQQIQRTARQSSINLPDPATGKPVFDEKCGSCHAGPLALESYLANTTPLDIGASMWNHVTAMRRIPALSEDQMRQVLAYVWDLQYRGPQGDAASGQRTFVQKGCDACHANRPIGKRVEPASFAAIGWGAGRSMHEKIETWPTLSPADIADLTAYINSIAGK